ncbi:MAG TPA: protein-L-isoaspartate(D-aspartate) O-methyltransferase [Candidatus Binatia bacterium]|nr:protein-L-isoaspartate(D-aspartate) O-methyltransferase [Candidatus Binatia bacterium]
MFQRLPDERFAMKLFGNKDFAAARKRMVRDQMPDIPPHVLSVMARVPRHEFVPEPKRSAAYEDMPLSIGHGQTISQPYIVALMTAQLDPQPTDRVLEIGTGSGYQAAVLARLVADVYTIEIVEPLAQRAEATLRRLGCNNVHLRLGDGSAGWPEAAPFDSVIVTCAPEEVPPALVHQLKEEGRLIIPVGPPGCQDLFLLQKHGGRLIEHSRVPVRFVPMTGQPESPEQFS